MKVALTGATGFVGRVVLAQLLSHGHQVKALVRSPAAAQILGDANIISGDLANEEALAELVRDSDVAVHVAGAIAAPDRKTFFAINEQGTQRVVAEASKAGVKRLIFISTLSATRPELTAYGGSKAAAEQAVKGASDIAERLIIRPPAVYGPGDKATLPLVKSLTNSPVVIAGQAVSRFSLIYVDDLARIICQAVTSEVTGTIEVDDGKRDGYSWHELVDAASRVEGRALKPYFLPRGLTMLAGAASEKVARLRGATTMVTTDKIRELYMPTWVAKPPGWHLDGATQFEQGLEKTLGWYREAGWLAPRRRANVRNTKISE